MFFFLDLGGFIKADILIGKYVTFSFPDFQSSQEHTLWACCFFYCLQQASAKVRLYSIYSLKENEYHFM